jgi:hypothetical protein
VTVSAPEKDAPVCVICQVIAPAPEKLPAESYAEPVHVPAMLALVAEGEGSVGVGVLPPLPPPHANTAALTASAAAIEKTNRYGRRMVRKRGASPYIKRVRPGQ